jgi:hypothetical protein
METITNEYRIVEFDGVFTIQVKVIVVEKRFLRKPVTHYEWYRADINGKYSFRNFGPVDYEPCWKFSSLEDAREQVMYWQNQPQPIYHSCD